MNQPGKDYTPLIEHLKGYGTWWHHLDSTWLVKTHRSVVELRDAVRALIDRNDEVLVVM